MIFPFQHVRVRQPVPSVGNTLVRWRPIISLGVARPDGRDRVFEDVIIDTGADDVTIPARLTAGLGIDLSTAPMVLQRGVTGRPFEVKYAEVELTLYAALDHFVRWRAVVGFAPIKRAVFGFAGGLQFFHANLDYTVGRFALVPRVNLPATESRFPEGTR